MQIIESPQEMQEWSVRYRCSDQSIGFVPTMGALHEGHLALAHAAQRDNHRWVASVFVNPIQFGPHEDLDKYPRPFERDCELLEAAGCNAVFRPSVETMYGNMAHEDMLHSPHTYVEVVKMGDIWEGVVRPGHLRGVATVVAKLFNIVSPNRAYFGEKDFQQLRLVQQMVRDLNFPIEIVPVPTVREADGLALSSRNVYLSTEEREAARVLSRALHCGVERAQGGEVEVTSLGEAMHAIIAAEPLVSLQYLTIVDAETLEPLERLDERPARILVAARVGKTRLIDNVPIP
jgi:pantoate--beta-alanine ligase